MPDQPPPADLVATPAAPAPHATYPSYSTLGLSTQLAQAAAATGWAVPTAVQAAALPVILQGRDLLAQAPTGTGKTAAFLLPVLHGLLARPGLDQERPRRLRALVLAPTRELAAQTAAIARSLAPQLRTVVAVGGLSINPQMMALRGGAHLVVATPGRLLDLLKQRALTLADVHILVLDEADRLLDLGFADELARLLAVLPVQRQTLLFSATLPDAVAALAARMQRDAVRVTVPALPGPTPPAGMGTVLPAQGPHAAFASGGSLAGRQAANPRPSALAADPVVSASAATAPAGPAITQRAIEVDSARRTPLLRHLIAAEGWSQVLVFVATQYATEHIADKLSRSGLLAAALHGQLSQGRRSHVLADFHQQRLRVLVATDLAARGLDLARMPVVVNHDLPRSALDYTHRIGRTGRAGARGQAVSFICADAPGSEAHFRLIEKRQGQPVPREQVAGFEPSSPALAVAPVVSTGGIKGQRKSRKDKLREAQARARK